VRLLLAAYPDSALSEPFAAGGLGLDYTWSQVIDSLTFSDGLLGRHDTLTSAVLPIARIWADGHTVSLFLTFALSHLRFLTLAFSHLQSSASCSFFLLPFNACTL